MQLSSYHQAILEGVEIAREAQKTDAEILDAALELLAKFATQSDNLASEVEGGGLLSILRITERLETLTQQAYSLLGEK